MFWNSKGNWKKPTKAGNSNEKPRQRTDEIMQRPVKPSKGVGKFRSEIVAKPKPQAKKVEPAKIVDPLPQPTKIEPKIESKIEPKIEVKVEPLLESIEEEVALIEEEEEETIVDTSLTRRELTAIADEKGISVSKRMSKQDIVDAINEE